MELRVQKACFAYEKEKFIFRDIDFMVSSGEILCILGQNGIGKTTLLKCIAGIHKLQSGDISFSQDEGLNIKKNLIKYIGYVQQMHQPMFSYTVEDMVLMGKAKNIGVFSAPKKKYYDEVYEILKQFDLFEKAKTPCNFLSGGQLQLVYIARALAADPKILILDEPESHLDYKNQKMILKFISRLIREKNLIGIINTHYPEHALHYSDKVLFLGKEKSQFGDSSLINEQILYEYFDTKSKIIEVEYEGEKIRSVVAV